MGLDNPLDSITQADLQELIDNRVAEKRVIDYKLELHAKSDRERKDRTEPTRLQVSVTSNNTEDRLFAQTPKAHRRLHSSLALIVTARQAQGRKLAVGVGVSSRLGRRERIRGR